jgi:hypothetical protein
MAVTLTYDSLVEQLPGYVERTDAAYAAQIPTLIMLAENRIATDMKQQGFQSVVAGTMTAGGNGAIIKKPAFWRETISFNFKDPTVGWLPLRLRSLEYLKNYWPLQSVLGQPRFYADYNSANFLLAASPDQAYPFELAYYARLQPLDSDNQVNWLTANAPQALLYASILESHIWLKNADKTQEFQGHYDNAKNGLLQENMERLGDRNEVVTRA